MITLQILVRETSSFTNSGWVANSSSNEGNTGGHNPPYILPALELSDISEIPIDLKDDLIFPITNKVLDKNILNCNIPV